MVGPTMNLISRTHHSCKRREYTFIVFREYTIIFLFLEGVAVIPGNPIQWVNAINEPQRKMDPGPLNSAPPSMPSPICVHSNVSQRTRAYSAWMVWNQRNKTQLNLQAASFHQVAE